MTGSNKEAESTTAVDSRTAERLRQFGIHFDRAVKQGVEQLRTFSSHTIGRISIPDLGFDLEYQTPDKDHPIESLTITHNNNLPGLVLETRFFTIEYDDGIFGITRTQALKKGDEVLAETEPERLSPESAARVTMIADNPVMKASQIELAVDPTREFDHKISAEIGKCGNSQDVRNWQYRNR